MVVELKMDTLAWTGSRYIDLCNPQPEDLDLNEIVLSLAYECRYNRMGTTVPWSVAQHSILAYHLALEDGIEDPVVLKTLLLHDAPEAYLRDVAGPLKHTEEMAAYRGIESRMWSAIAQRWGLPIRVPEVVHYYDMLCRASEKAALVCPEAGEWESLAGITPRPIPLGLVYGQPGDVISSFLHFLSRHIDPRQFGARSRL